MLGEWGAERENVNLLVHSLGNLVTLDALRLNSVESDQKLIHNMISVEAAIWKKLCGISARQSTARTVSFSVEELMRGSWAFWFGQEGHPVSEQMDALFNSFASEDFVLELMKYNDALPLSRTTLPQFEDPGNDNCPRVRRIIGRGLARATGFP